jgi:hypothetical protein
MDKVIFTFHVPFDLLRSRGESGRILSQNTALDTALAFIRLEALRERQKY